MASGYLRGAFESVVGNETNTPTLSTKKVFFPIQEFQPNLGPEPLTRDDELRNLDQSVAGVPDTYSPSYSYTSRAYPDLTGFMLAHTLGRTDNYAVTTGNGVITDPDGTTIPTGAYRHVWTSPFGPDGNSPLTAQYDVAYADQSTFFKLKGAGVESVTLDSPQEGGGSSLQVAGPAAYMNRQSDPSLSATYEALSVRPFRRGQLSIPTWLSGTATHENVSVSIARAIEFVRSMSISSKWPDDVQYSNDPISTILTGSLEQRFVDPDDWDALRDLTGFSATIRWLNDSNIAASYPYKLYIVMSNCEYTEGEPEPLGNKRRHGQTFTFRATSADGTTAASTITLVNATASYA